jgi:beta-galactosidase GanA
VRLRTKIATLGLVGLLSTTCVAQMPKDIIVGTVYNVFNEEYPTDRDFFSEVDRDVNLMKESNINHVMIFPMGEWDPATKKLDWARTDYLVNKIRDAGMKFVPLMLKEEQCYNYFPIWKFKDIPGMWEEHDLNNGNKDNRDNIDFDDPRVYPLVESYFRQVIERYGNNPALSFYNIWNEPHYSSTQPHVIVSFREWLKDKYGSLSALRRSWGIEYSSWNEVSPFLTEDWKSSMPGIDWTLFRSELNGTLLGELTRTLRKYDSVHATNANPVGTPWANFSPLGGYSVDNWAVASHDDIAGISYYPDGWERAHGLEPCPFWLHDLTFNIVRSAAGDRPYILTELYTNTQNGLALNGYLTKKSVTLLAWTALADNCKGMIYWKWLPFMRGRQSLGRGLCRVDGSLSERGEAVKQLGAVVDKYGPVLYRAQLEKPRVAILLDLVGLIKTLEQTVEPATNEFMYESNAGLFKALYEGGITADFLRMDRGLTLEELKAYKIIFLPFQVVMRPEIAAVLKAYVDQGGWLVADARTATLDEFDFAYKTNPGAGLDSLFGARSPDWIAQKSYFDVSLDSMPGMQPQVFQGKYFREQLDVYGTARVIGRYTDTGKPAVVMNKYGKGMAFMSAVPLGASYLDKPDNAVKEFILRLVSDAGVDPDAKFSSNDGGFVNLRVHALDSMRVVYLINSDDTDRAGELEVNVGKLNVNSVVDIITDRTLPFTKQNGRIKLNLDVAPDQVSVLLIR